MIAMVPMREERRLEPGELFSGKGAYALRAVVGHGVCVCLWDPRSRVGGMNHYVAPTGRPAGFRFGVFALSELLCRVRTLTGPGPLEARIFGGASSTWEEKLLARENVALAHEVLNAVGVPIVSQVVFGTRPRRVAFDLESGDAFCAEAP